MATVENLDDDSGSTTSGQGQSTQSNAPTVGGPQAAGPSTPGGNGGGNNGSNPRSVQTSSGSYNNLQKYMDANSGFNAQGGGLAGKIVNNVNDQAQGLQSNLQGAQNAFAQQSQAAAGSFNNPNMVSQALADPNAFVQDPNNVSAFNNIVNAKYTGPNSFQDLSGQQNLSNLQAQGNNLNDTVNQAQSESGRFNLLKQMFGNNNYSAGQQNLDNLLIQGNQGQLKQIQAVRPTAMNATTNLNNANNAAQAQANQYTQQAANVASDTQNQLNQSVIDQNTALTNAATAAQAKQQSDLQNLYGSLSQGGTVNPNLFSSVGGSTSNTANQLQALQDYNQLGGIFQNQIMQPLNATGYSDALYKQHQGDPDWMELNAIGNHVGTINDALGANQVNLNAGDGLFTAAPSATAQTIASSADYAKLAALNQLMGGTGTTPGSVANTQASGLLAQYLPNAGQAGTYSSQPDVSINTPALQQMLQSAQSGVAGSTPMVQGLQNGAKNIIQPLLPGTNAYLNQVNLINQLLGTGAVTTPLSSIASSPSVNGAPESTDAQRT